MVKLSRAIAAVLLCSGLLFSAGLVRATQEKPPPEAQKAQKNEKAKPAPDQRKPAPAEEKAPEQENTVTFSGKVTKVTDTDVTIVDDQKAEHTVVLTADTKITKGGKDAAASDVKADDLVTILAKKGDGDALMAVKIAVS